MTSIIACFGLSEKIIAIMTNVKTALYLRNILPFNPAMIVGINKMPTIAKNKMIHMRSCCNLTQ